MIAVDIESISNLKDWVILTNIHYALNCYEYSQIITELKNLDFKKLKLNEPLYLVGHGLSGVLLETNMCSYSVKTENENEPGLNKIIKKAFLNGGGYYPKLINILSCWSANDLNNGNLFKTSEIKTGTNGMPSLVRSISITLAKLNKNNVQVTGYLGPAVSASNIGCTRVILPDKSNKADEIQNHLQKKYGITDNYLKSELKFKLIQNRSSAVALKTQCFYAEFINELEKHN